jgi:hypothetical protein
VHAPLSSFSFGRRRSPRWFSSAFHRIGELQRRANARTARREMTARLSLALVLTTLVDSTFAYAGSYSDAQCVSSRSGSKKGPGPSLFTP